MKKTYYLYVILSVSAILLALAGGHSRAEESAAVKKYDDQIGDAKKEQKEIEKKSRELQREIEELEKDRDKTLIYIEKLDRKSAALEEDLAQLEEGIRSGEDELETASVELRAAEETEEKQYATMKKRIRYMYENGNQDYLAILFSSRDIGDLLNRAEYIEKISSYDRNIFIEYRETKAKIEQKRSEVKQKLSELEHMRAEVSAEKDALNKMKKRKKSELESYKEQLDISQEKADEYAREAAQAEAQVEKLLQEKQAEIDRQNAMGSGDSGGGSGKLRWPLNVSGRISSGFGKRSSPTAGASTYHKGIDIAASSGTPVLAAAAGEVVTAAYSSSAGNYIMLSHGNRLYTVYMHCSRLAVKEGDTVTAGQVIGYVGSTGISTGPHLHFGVSKNGSYVDPLIYVSQK